MVQARESRESRGGDKGDGEWEEAKEAGEGVGLAGSELLDYEARLLWISAVMYSR